MPQPWNEIPKGEGEKISSQVVKELELSLNILIKHEADVNYPCNYDKISAQESKFLNEVTDENARQVMYEQYYKIGLFSRLYRNSAALPLREEMDKFIINQVVDKGISMNWKDPVFPTGGTILTIQGMSRENQTDFLCRFLAKSPAAILDYLTTDKVDENGYSDEYADREKKRFIQFLEGCPLSAESYSKLAQKVVSKYPDKNDAMARPTLSGIYRKEWYNADNKAIIAITAAIDAEYDKIAQEGKSRKEAEENVNALTD